MTVRSLFPSLENASASARAEGAGELARAWLRGELQPEAREKAEQAFYALLDDPSPLPRRALAEAFAAAIDAPPALIMALACDPSPASAVVLARSKLLSDAQLIDCAAIGAAAAQAAIALRPSLSAAVSAALAEIGAREALIALAVNEGANLPEFAMRRMVERFWDDGELREALLGRAWLPATVRAALAAAAARQLTDFAVARNWMARARCESIARDSRDRATMIIAAGCADYSDETAALAAYLRVSGQLTAGLALRALLCGQTGLFEATLSELTGLGPRRVAGLIKDPASPGFAAIYSRADLPASLMRAFQIALVELARITPEEKDDGALRLPVVRAVLSQCEGAGDENLARLIALLRRFEADAMRETGRRAIERMKRETPAAETPAAPMPVVAPAIAATGVTLAESAPEPACEAAAPDEQQPFAVDLGALEKELIAA